MTGTSETSTLRSVHRLLEHYTPDGMLGRVLLGGTALGLAPFLIIGSWAVLSGGAMLPLLVMSLFTLVAGVAAFPIGIVALWPVYLSLIGNVESPAAYGDHSAGQYADAPDRRSETPDSPEAVLKRRYAAGELGREEFECRLDDVMETGERSRTDDARLETSRSR